MGVAQKLEKDELGKIVDKKLYKGMVGPLLYLTSSHPDIMYSVCLCERFLVDPKESHLIAVKRIFRYMKGTQNLGLWFPLNGEFDSIAYSDADFGVVEHIGKALVGHVNF